MTAKEPTDPRPWYRHAWPWLLMLPPAASVVAGATMVYLAVDEPHDLAVSDYSRIEELTEERFARDAAAVALGLGAVAEFSAGEGGATGVSVDLDGGAGFRAPPALVLTMRHSGFAAGDRRIVLERAVDGYSGAAMLLEGRYDIELTPPDSSWRLAGSVTRVPGTVRLFAQRAAGR